MRTRDVVLSYSFLHKDILWTWGHSACQLNRRSSSCGAMNASQIKADTESSHVVNNFTESDSLLNVTKARNIYITQLSWSVSWRTNHSLDSCSIFSPCWRLFRTLNSANDQEPVLQCFRETACVLTHHLQSIILIFICRWAWLNLARKCLLSCRWTFNR